MRPTDARVRRQLAPARRPLAWVLASGVVGSLLLVAQAFSVAGLVVAVVGGDGVGGPAALVLAVLVARSLVSWVGDVAAARAAATVGTDLRRRAVAATLDGRTTAPTGEVSVLATRGVAAAEPFLTRYVPALVLACVLPLVALATISILDPLSGLIVLVTLPLVPVFGILVGQATEDRARSQWWALASLSGHFVDVMRGLPTLVAFRRAEGQSAAIRAYTDRYRRRALRTLRLAFASSAVLELVATLSVALVAVTVGLRLAEGNLELRTALVVLLLAPEAYWPLRRVGAEFHAAAEGAATFEAACGLLDEPPEPPGATSRQRRSARGARTDRGPPRAHGAGAGRCVPGAPRPGRDRRDGSLRRWEVHVAGRARRPAGADVGAGADGRSTRLRGRPAGAGRVVIPTAGLPGRDPGRQPSPGRAGRAGRAALGRAAPGRARGARTRPPGRAGHAA